MDHSLYPEAKLGCPCEECSNRREDKRTREKNSRGLASRMANNTDLCGFCCQPFSSCCNDPCGNRLKLKRYTVTTLGFFNNKQAKLQALRDEKKTLAAKIGAEKKKASDAIVPSKKSITVAWEWINLPKRPATTLCSGFDYSELEARVVARMEAKEKAQEEAHKATHRLTKLDCIRIVMEAHHKSQAWKTSMVFPRANTFVTVSGNEENLSIKVTRNE